MEDDFPFTPRHTFAAGTILRAGEAIALFGGGDVSTLSGDHVSYTTAVNDDPGLENGLSLNNEGEVVAPAKKQTGAEYGRPAQPA